MPEGDTVWLTAHRLDAALGGRRLLRTDLRVPGLSTVDLSGRTLLEVASRGKHLLLRVESGVTLHCHLGMEGSWHLYGPRERWRGGPGHEVRAVLEGQERTAVGYRLPVLELLPTAEEETVVGHLGPDLLGSDWDAAQAVRNLAARPDRPLGEALLDQRTLAGVGNVYVSELCFLRGVTPWTPFGRVPAPGRLVALAHRLLLANRTRPGHVTTGDTRRGRAHWVYGREHQPCLRCGTPVRRGVHGPPDQNRVAYWCPRCQAGPSPSDPASSDPASSSPASPSRTPPGPAPSSPGPSPQGPGAGS
ncbi:Fpg/Nei family DNA glycosylase [Actinacidiphila yeochonensis]|uniref:Fpg/Nei family DNA glycosylase n=1 Tax=Actinacidiphila yeochonensis TaxID=89050 RepID=UPI00099D315B|nr:DNA-formamidopyrimidine glycosylase family protein [Actinacidiphila yeochonensis]